MGVLSTQGKAPATDGGVGTIDSGTGFTILSEKKLFLGQKVQSLIALQRCNSLSFCAFYLCAAINIL